MELTGDQLERGKRIAELLLANQELKNPLEQWGEIAAYASKVKSEQKRIANAFLLSCLLDYRRRPGDDPWDAVDAFLKATPHFQDDLWKRITSDYSRQDWCEKATFEKYNLHWMRPAHNRLWPIAESICYWFDGDAGNIWSDGDAFSTLARLYWIGAGEQISRMIVGALKDCKIVSGKGDPKADNRVCRVIGRCVLGEAIDPVNAFDAIRICRELYPEDPWQLDNPIWLLGEKTCTDKNPVCGNCYLHEKCAFVRTISAA